MTEEECKLFNHSLKTINWDESIYSFSYGLRRFFIKEDTLSPVSSGYNQLLAKNQTGLFHDMKMAISRTSSLKQMDNFGYLSTILNKQKFDDYVRFKIGEPNVQSLGRQQKGVQGLISPKELTKN